MIRELDKSDYNSILKLEVNFGYALKDVIYDLDSNPFSHYLLYIDNDMILGYLNYYLMYDRIEIAAFNVLEKYQNNHIGTNLLKELINNYIGKVSNITLEVKKDNIKAINLYKKMGFVEKAIRKRYYNGIDGILMEREMIK